jgi:predicted nuclease of predicted toxin-antitoxin system
VKLLVDNCLSRELADRLAEAGHDVVWMGDLGPDPGDASILERAHVERRVVITRDQDFATLALAYGHRHAGILRIMDTSTMESIAICFEALATRHDELMDGGVVIAFPDRSRAHKPKGVP